MKKNRPTFIPRLGAGIALGCVLLANRSLGAQAASAPGSASAAPVVSIGQPPRWDQYGAGLGAVTAAPHDNSAFLLYGVHHAIINRVAGVFGVAAEGYAGLGGETSGGAHLLATVPALAIAGGIDWNARGGGVSPLLSYASAIRRGGLLGHGSMLRVDWMPWRDNSVSVGVAMPLFRPLAGRTRPRSTRVSLERLATHAAGTPAADAGTRPIPELPPLLTALVGYSNAYSVHSTSDQRTSYADALDRYQAALGRAFSAAAGDSALASRAVRRARAALFERVIVPIDSLFGEPKEDADNLAPLTAVAAGEFARWVADSAGASPGARRELEATFAGWLASVAGLYHDMLHRENDSRVVWLPVDLALTPDQYDDQAEVDSLISRTVGHPFTDNNALTYLSSADLPLEIARSIYAARDYHVLWTHDFTGRKEDGSIDNIAYSMVADAYLPALTAAVKRYDSTGVIPTYVILQDEFFYEPRDGRLWMTMLEDPLHASMHLPPDTTQRQQHLLARQAELRAAVAASARLQRDAAATGHPDAWLRRMIKVHVNVTQPADFSFRSLHIVPHIPFTPDNIMRDHRKIVFYDLNEAEPYRGAMYLMGIGIGEHYASATWEDRGYRLRGPATLEVRAAVRSVLRRNGLGEDDIPAPLRAVASAPAEERRNNVGDYIGRVLQVHNEVGFGAKHSSVARAMLYDLAEPGSVIIVPDPMWLSDTWAGMLAAAAARGCRVYVIAPATANAPSPQGILMALQHDVLARLLGARRELYPEIRRAGGDLRIGMFAAHAPVDDPAGRAREVRDGLARAPWIRDVVPFDQKTLAVLDRAEAQSASGGGDATKLAHDVTPRDLQLHQKSQLIARPGAIAALVRQPGWDDVLAQTMRVQSRQTAQFADQFTWTTPDIDSAATRNADALLRNYEQGIPEAERKRVTFYFSLGTQNQDDRGIVSDGEASLIVSGVYASAGLVDLYYLMARSNWIENVTDLNRFNPPRSGLLTRLARFVRSAL